MTYEPPGMRSQLPCPRCTGGEGDCTCPAPTIEQHRRLEAARDRYVALLLEMRHAEAVESVEDFLDDIAEALPELVVREAR